MAGRSGLFDFSFLTAMAVTLAVLTILTSRTDAVVVVRVFSNFGPLASVGCDSMFTLLGMADVFITLLRVIGFVQCVSTRGFTFFISIMPNIGT